jgi:hypothetical protein
MSIIGIHIHLHDDVLAKFGASLIDGVLAAMKRCVAVKSFLPLEFPVQTNTDRSF